MNNSTSTNSSGLHVISLSKKDMDTKQDLEMHGEYGEEERGVKRNLQPVLSSIQGGQASSFPYRHLWTTKINNDKERWDPIYNSDPMGCYLPSIYDQFSAKKEESKKFDNEYESSGYSNSTSKSNCLLDNHTGTQKQRDRKVSDNNQCFLENKPAKNNQYRIWSINYNSRGMVQRLLNQNPTKERDDRQISISSISGWERDIKQRTLGIWKLCGSQSMDSTISVEVGSSNKILHHKSTEPRSNATMQKLPELSEITKMIKQLKNSKPYGIHETTDEEVLDSELRTYLHKSFGISGVHPVFVDDSRMVIWMLDDCDNMFRWNEMEQSMDYLGMNLKEGLANLLYHPEKIYNMQ
ncbi:hypothetical protein C1645_742937 [Glomus cerebriforme]|uniref:Uncharacterized protein n=1 Tax=Glomus cerebriforme TaxID=658196 RepID=A0A397SLA8_9GLOM|nr:hypothetical protein C1645_742937 [Glomus cerebriforme]